jgi:hypothetical protein
LTDPARYLPETYLRAVGLLAPEETESDDVELIEQNFQADDAAPEDPSVDRRIHGNMTARLAWSAALSQLQAEMPKSTFDIWVKGTQAVEYTDGLVIVRAGNAYQREWLEGRLTSTAIRILTGLLNQSMRVRFITGDDDHER